MAKDAAPRVLQVMSEMEEIEEDTEPDHQAMPQGSTRHTRFLTLFVGLALALAGLAFLARPPSTPMALETDSAKRQLQQLFDLQDIAKKNFTEMSSEFTSGISAINRGLQDISDIQKKLKQEMGPLVLASCVVDVYNAASLMSQLGAIITGTVNNCEKKDRYDNFLKHPELINQAFQFTDPEDRQRIHEVLWRGCNVGIESSIATASFVAAFLANAADSCAMSMKAPPNADATCARDVAFLAGSFSWLAAASEVIAASCPPNPLLDKYPTLGKLVAGELVSVFNRRLSNSSEEPRLNKLPNEIPLDILDSLGPLGNFIYKNHEAVKISREEHHKQQRREHEAKCAVDVTGVVGFAACVGVYIKAATLECPLAPVGGKNFQMGCSMDVSAVAAAFLAAAGYISVMAVECPEDTPPNPQKAVCAAGIINVLASLTKMTVAFSDVARSCAPHKD